MAVTAAALSVEDVSVRFGATLAVDQVSLQVATGETLAVVGPSGSGKSTLLRAVAGLEPLAGGVIRAGGRSLAGVRVHERDMGLMFQDHALFPHLDVADNVAFGLRMKGWPGGRRRERVGELLALVGLAGLGGRAVHELSGGEAQRVALARALAPEPALLMLDEPFGSLDRVLREQLTGEVRRLLADLGQTALHVTHDQGEAFALADRVAVLAGGRLVQVGEPAELWRRPATAFVAEFLGHPNRWSAWPDGAGGWSVHGVPLGPGPDGDGLGPRPPSPEPPSRFSSPPPSPAVSRSREGPVPVVVPVTAVRPAADGVVAAEVTAVEFRQGRYRVMAGVKGAEPALTVVFEADAAPGVGETVALAVDLDQIWLLP